MFNFYSFLRKKWSEISNASGQKGTIIDDLAIRPTGLILSEFHNKLVDQVAMNDISNWNRMSESQLDFFGNKFFNPRIRGDYAFGIARIWFDRSYNIEIGENARFVSKGGFQYRPVSPNFISKNSFTPSFDRFALFYLDIPIIAVSAGNSYNVEAGDIVQLINIDFTYKSVTNPKPIKSGSKHETNDEYFKRLRYSINDRSLMNKRSIYQKLPEFFPSIMSMYISGSGNKYMQRDLVNIQDSSSGNAFADFLGKTSGDNMVKHIAFYGTFPPEAGNPRSELWGPKSIRSDYDYPLTIDPSDVLSNDPAFHGFQLDQEFTDSMYKGLYFDDFKNHAEIKTRDLFNIDDVGVGFTPVVVPGPDWVHGAHGRGVGNLGRLYDGINDLQVMSFHNNSIRLSGGSFESKVVGIDIKKRVGVKVSGSFVWPQLLGDDTKATNSNLQIMIGGVRSEIIDGYTGIGFGVRVNSAYVSDTEDPSLPPNASIYFAHSEKYGSAQIFATDEDFNSHTGITDIGALAEVGFRIEPGSEYEFEFVVHDDLRLTLHLNKLDNRLSFDLDGKENTLNFQLPPSALSVFGSETNGLLSRDSTRYGTMMNVVLDTNSTSIHDTWYVNDLSAVDISKHKSMALIGLNVKNIESPLSIMLRVFGLSEVGGSSSGGVLTYIWDLESNSPASKSGDLIVGGWRLLSDISDPDGSRYNSGELMKQDLQSIDRYLVNSRYGKNIFLMVTTSGWSKPSMKFFGDSFNDIHSELTIDYVKVSGINMNSYHSNNKSDIYVSTVKNSELLESVVVTLTKNSSESFFVLDSSVLAMPVAEIVSVTPGVSVENSEPLAITDYFIKWPTFETKGSSKESIEIAVKNYDMNAITVQCRIYPDISDIQDFFDGSQYEKVFGDILIKHKYPVGLSMSVYYSGDTDDNKIIDEIRGYVDSNNSDVFSVKSMVNHLYGKNVVNNIKEPIEVSYTMYEDGVVKSGVFTDHLKIRPIDFFRIVNINVGSL
jgi:hypothetical protein